MEPAPLYEDVADAPGGGEAYWLTAPDGVRLRAGLWREGEKGTVLLLPGRTEYVEKYGRGVADLRERGYASAVIDWRGQGLADRLATEYSLGHVGHFSDYQKDLKAFCDLVEAQGMPKPWYLVGHSMGGCIGLRAVHEGLDVRAAAFTGPMWRIYISPWIRPMARMVSRGSRPLGLGLRYAPTTEARHYAIANPFENNVLTTDREMFDYMVRQMVEHPDLVIGGPSMHWLSEALEETLVRADLSAPPVPSVVLIGSDEVVVDSFAVRRIVRDWANSELIVLPGGQHEVLMETPAIRKRCYDAMCALFDANR